MSIEYTILCTRLPNAFLGEPVERLEWDRARGSGCFGALDLTLRSLEEHDPLPDPTWASRVVAVLHVEGHMTDDDHYDAFDDWSMALADATQGAIYNQWRGAFAYVSREDAPREDALTWAESTPAPDLPERTVLLDGRTILAFEEDDILGLRAPKGHELPRRPRATAAYELAGTRPLEAGYIVTVGTYAPGHFEGPDFQGAKLVGDATRLAGLDPGKRYCVTGFYQPPVGSPIVGFGGPTLHVMSIAAEPAGPRRTEAPRWVMPVSPSRRGPVVALLHPAEDRGHEQVELSTRPDPSTLVVAALDAAGGQSTGAAAAEVAQLTLATVLAEPDYAPHLGPPVEPPAWVFDGLSEWVSWLVDRGPLPHEPDALAIALGNRIGEVLEGVNLRGCAMSAWGIIAVIRGGRATLVRRGMARAYLVRDGELQPLVYEHVLGREPAVVAQPELAAAMAEHAWVMVSSFAPVDPPGATPPLELEVRPGDRLVFVVGQEVLQALADPARERRLSAALPDVTSEMPPTPAMLEHGWGVVAVDIEPW